MKNKIVIACDSFKGSLSSTEVGRAAMRGIETALPQVEVEVIPVADGGEGTTEAIIEAVGGKIAECIVSGPLGDPVTARYGYYGHTAVIEMAQASGITLISPERRNPWLTTTYGTGQLIADALERGCRNFLIGIGGSATNDGGTGMLEALGFRFLDKNGRTTAHGGGELSRIDSIDTSEVNPLLREATFTVACDVTNPLTGPTGASHVFGPQKGADPAMVKALDNGLANYARVVDAYIGKDLSAAPGTGAAGGMGFAFLALLGARLQPGIEMVLDAVDFDAKIKGAKLVITGEGYLDSQTCMGKTPQGVLKRAAARDIPVIAIGGGVQPSAVAALMSAGFSAVFPIVAGPVALEEAMKPDVAAQNVERTASQIIRTAMLSL